MKNQEPPAQGQSLDERVDESLQESFPASDPPAVHQSDIPPANGSAKWDAAAITAHSQVGHPPPQKPGPPAEYPHKAVDT